MNLEVRNSLLLGVKSLYRTLQSDDELGEYMLSWLCSSFSLMAQDGK